jgi:cytochrome bd ubiquinol oxidase subunit II
MVMFWVSLLAISILLYVLLDGADLGIGMLFGLRQGEAKRRVMLKAVSPIWDGNETWLVVTGVILWGAFPLVYATLLSAFYLPLFFILAGLILRGVAFEFRDKTQQMRWIWDLSFAGGSLLASFMQGTTVGALVEGLQVTDGQYSGGDFGWLTPFAALCGVGLCLGYALLGACWLVKKCDAEVRDRAHRQIRVLAVCVLVFLVVVFVYALAEHLPILHRWIDRPYLFAFPAVGGVAAIVLALSILRQNVNRRGVPTPIGELSY